MSSQMIVRHGNLAPATIANRGRRLLHEYAIPRTAAPARSNNHIATNAQNIANLFTQVSNGPNDTAGLSSQTYGSMCTFIGVPGSSGGGSHWFFAVSRDGQSIQWSGGRYFDSALYFSEFLAAHLYRVYGNQHVGIGRIKNISTCRISCQQWRFLVSALGYSASDDTWYRFVSGQNRFNMFLATNVGHGSVYFWCQHHDRWSAGVRIIGLSINPARRQMTIHFGVPPSTGFTVPKNKKGVVVSQVPPSNNMISYAPQK